MQRPLRRSRSFKVTDFGTKIDDLERRNNCVNAVTMRYFTEFGSLQVHYIKVVEDTLTLSAAEM